MVTVKLLGLAQLSVAVIPGVMEPSEVANGPQPLSEVAPMFLMTTVADVGVTCVQLEREAYIGYGSHQKHGCYLR